MGFDLPVVFPFDIFFLLGSLSYSVNKPRFFFFFFVVVSRSFCFKCWPPRLQGGARQIVSPSFCFHFSFFSLSICLLLFLVSL